MLLELPKYLKFSSEMGEPSTSRTDLQVGSSEVAQNVPKSHNSHALLVSPKQVMVPTVRILIFLKYSPT